MNTLLWILSATTLVSLIAFIGVMTLALKKKKLERITLYLVSLSAGTLTGNAFFHLIPESLENLNPNKLFITVIAGITLFLFIEKVLHLHHCHKGVCKVHPFAYLSLIGESIHNFIDGLIIAASFMINIPLGIATTIAISSHEIPQEIGDFAVLIHGGFSKGKALIYNFLTAITAILGGLVGYYLSSYAAVSAQYLLPFAAGGFIYIGISDLLPEIRKENEIGKAAMNFLLFLLGVIIMYVMKLII